MITTRFQGIIFDFDGVLLESEYDGNRHIAEYLTGIGHPTTPEHSMANFMGLAGQGFIDAIEAYIAGPLPRDFHDVRKIENRRAMAEGVPAVAGAIAFIRALPDSLPRAIASSSASEWIEAHLDHLGIRDAFDGRIFSGREHVRHGKPAPDIYLHAAANIGIDISHLVILEDSPVGATGAVASGAHVIGLCAGSHCGIGHDARLRVIGVHDIAHDFNEVTRLIA